MRTTTEPKSGCIHEQSKSCHLRTCFLRGAEEGRFLYTCPVEAASRIASKNDFTVVGEYEDTETAKVTGRTQFNEMVKFLQKEGQSSKDNR